MNKVILVGNITKELELRKTQSNKSVLEFRIAINEGYGDHKRTEYVSCVAWEGRADTINQYFNKGSKILVEGKLRTESYEFEGQKRYKTYVLVDGFEFMQSNKNSVRAVSEDDVDELKYEEPQQSEPEVYYEQNSLPFY